MPDVDDTPQLDLTTARTTYNTEVYDRLVVHTAFLQELADQNAQEARDLADHPHTDRVAAKVGRELARAARARSMRAQERRTGFLEALTMLGLADAVQIDAADLLKADDPY